jgi:UDPglucose 6-dehydrogenase
VFRAPDFDLIRERLTDPVIFDGRNLYDPARMARKGFAYYAIGRGLRPDQPTAAMPAAVAAAAG